MLGCSKDKYKELRPVGGVTEDHVKEAGGGDPGAILVALLVVLSFLLFVALGGVHLLWKKGLRRRHGKRLKHST